MSIQQDIIVIGGGHAGMRGRVGCGQDGVPGSPADY